MEIVDFHVHLGFDFYNKYFLHEDTLITIMQKNNVSKSVVFACQGNNEDVPYMSANKEIYAISCKYPDKLIPFYFFYPCMESIKILKEDKEKWRGIKIYPNGSYKMDNIYLRILGDIVNDNNFPIVAHSDIEVQLCNELVSFAKGISSTFIVSHCFHLAREPLETAADLRNVYLDISPWCTMFRFAEKTLANKKDRFMGERNLSPEEYLFELYNLMNGRLVWGTDSPFYDKKSIGYTEEVKFFNSLPIEIRRTIIENAHTILNLEKWGEC